MKVNLCLISTSIVFLLWQAQPAPRVELRWGAPTAGAIERVGYVHAPAGRLRTAVWTLEYLDPVKMRLCDTVDATRRNFYVDTDQPVEFRAASADYADPNIDRGHLCPAADCRWSREAMLSSFILTNTAPQDSVFNRGAWNQLEQHVRTLARTQELWVCTIPLWIPDDAPAQGTLARNTPSVTYRVIGENHLPVPSHFAKCVLLKNGEAITMQSWLMANKPARAADLDECRVSVDFIEHWSGLALFDKLPLKQQNELESRP